MVMVILLYCYKQALFLTFCTIKHIVDDDDDFDGIMLAYE